MDRKNLALAFLMSAAGASQGVHCDRPASEICEDQYVRCGRIAPNDAGAKICDQQREWCRGKVETVLSAKD